LVEVKLSSNKKIVHGFETQLKTYIEAEGALRAIYLVADVGTTGKWRERLDKLRGDVRKKDSNCPEIVVVDGTIKLSASKA
jgi:hypothetical protein